jgi:hypothetical protein
MKTMRASGVFLLLLLAAGVALAADVSGKWVAQVPGRGGQTREMTFDFKADGDKLTGTITGMRGTTDISDGKINRDEISFTQVLEFNGNQMKILYKGTVSGEEIKFTRQREGGGEGQGGRAMEFTAKRPS